MPSLFLYISDLPLREAVAEQIEIANFGKTKIIDPLNTATDLSAEGAPSIVIIDNAPLPKNLEIFLRAGRENQEKPIVLMLGNVEDIDGVTESFPKPLRLGHLIARLKYYLETAPLLRDRVITFGPCRLEPQNRRIVRENETEPIRLTEKETALIVFLAQSKTPPTREDILASVWGYDERIDTHTLETHIYQLRRKLNKENEDWLVSEAGTYRLAGVGA
jgi:DNA-binding response OmpR family regulator